MSELEDLATIPDNDGERQLRAEADLQAFVRAMSPQLADAKSAVDLPPPVERLLGNAHPVYHFGDRLSRLRRLQRARNLLLSVPALVGCAGLRLRV
jgi:hypothetical protein